MARAAQRHRAVDAGRHEADAPVPAGMAGGLADEVHVDAFEPVGLVVLGEGHRERMGVGAGLGDVAGDIELERRACFRPACTLPVTSMSWRMNMLSTLATSSPLSVDFGDASRLRSSVRVRWPSTISAGTTEAAVNGPWGMVDPHDVHLVGAEIGVGNAARRKKRGVHVARQHDRQVDGGLSWGSEAEFPSKIKFAIATHGR